MKRQHLNQAMFSGGASLLLLLAQISGCSEGSNDAPGRTTVVTGGANAGGGTSNGKGGSAQGGDGSGAESNGGQSENTAGADNGSGGTGNDSGGQGAGGTPDNGCAPELTGDDCWTCPEEPEQYLNQCSAAQCAPFTNDEAHLPLLNDDGTLPPLP